MRRQQGLLLLFVFIAFGCGTTTRKQLRDTQTPIPVMALEDLELRRDVDDGAGNRKCADPLLRDRNIERFQNGRGGVFTIGVIELADDGHIADDDERDAVFGELKRLACETPDCKRGPGALVVTFVHGWHHRAKVCDNNMACFRRVIRALSAAEDLRAQAANLMPRPVIGIYVGWRGDNLERATFLSFYNRKRTAHHIGSHGGKEVLVDLGDLYEELNEKLKSESRAHPVTLVTVGHSFGGALVYSAIEGKLRRELKSRHNVGRPAGGDGIRPIRPGVGDLVVLVNPAFEAYRYRDFAADLKTTGHYADGQLPVLLTVASAADQAVGLAFPIGRSLYFTVFPWELEDISNVIGVGHYDPQTTHDLVVMQNGQQVTLPAIPKAKTTEADAATKTRCELDTKHGDLATCECVYPVPDEDELLRQMLGQGRANMVNAGEGSVAVIDATRGARVVYDEPEGARVTLRARSDTADPRSPFLVARTTADIISGHSEIYNPRFVTFLVGYISDFLQQQSEAPPEK